MEGEHQGCEKGSTVVCVVGRWYCGNHQGIVKDPRWLHLYVCEIVLELGNVQCAIAVK